ncbi:restriction endonuclease [Candidatus Poribacteria bacterium]|nr:restriction endonuclease [Candidatus Poribacteria bacterium]
MPSPACDQAILDAGRCGKAVLKFISPNDVGLTGGHQCGYYLPKAQWAAFTPQPPQKGVNHDHHVQAVWVQDGRITDSVVKWYGTGTRSEYRMTHFGRDFPYLTADRVGSLLILIPERMDRFLMYVFDLEDDIEDVQAGLGVQVTGRWAFYDRDAGASPEGEDDCIDRHFCEFSKALTDFPPTTSFAGEARQALLDCVNAFVSKPSDAQLQLFVEAEYQLFRLVERRVCEPKVLRAFKSVDDFLRTAQTILQRRKARAGRSLELHVEYLLREAKLPFDVRVDVDGTKPDVLIPGKKEYEDPDFPLEKLFVLGVKTTCKDRWRQVTREAPRVTHKHILTLQQGVSSAQLDEMRQLNVDLVVPQHLHTDYPPSHRAGILTVEGFISEVRARLRA